MRFRNGIASSPEAAAVEAVVEEARPGVHRRIHVAEVPLVGGELPVRVLVALAAASAPAARAAKSGSTNASGDEWKARSQAANQGYSHLSGMEMMSALNMWNQCWLRTSCRRRLAGSTPRSFSHLLHVVDVRLLRPQQARVALADARCAASSLSDGGMIVVVELVGLVLAGRRTSARSRPNGSATLARRARRQAQADRARSARRPRSTTVCAAALVPFCAGLTASWRR